VADNPGYSSESGLLLHISQQIYRLYSDIEDEKQIIIPPSVRSFTEALITEAFMLGRRGSRSVEQFIEDSLKSASLILSNAETLDVNHHKYVTLIGVVQQVNSQWCKIFPFCKN
jgi:hypothetical protein